MTVQVSPHPAPELTVRAPTVTVQVSREREDDPTTEFRSDAPHIFVRGSGQHRPVGAVVRVAWIAEDVGEVVEPNFIVDETESEVTAPEFGARFTFSHPSDGWAAGNYRVELFLDDTLLEIMRITVD